MNRGLLRTVLPTLVEWRLNPLPNAEGTSIMIDPELLKILVCPENKTPVRLADEDLVRRANAAIEAKTLKNRGGELVEPGIDAGLVREDNAYMYPVREDIPIMLIDEAIPLDQLN